MYKCQIAGGSAFGKKDWFGKVKENQKKTT